MALKDDHLQEAKRKVSEQKKESAAKRVKANSGAKKDIQSAPQGAEKAKCVLVSALLAPSICWVTRQLDVICVHCRGGPASGKQQEKQQKHRSKNIQVRHMKSWHVSVEEQVTQCLQCMSCVWAHRMQL